VLKLDKSGVDAGNNIAFMFSDTIVELSTCCVQKCQLDDPTGPAPAGARGWLPPTEKLPPPPGRLHGKAYYLSFVQVVSALLRGNWHWQDFN